MDDLLDSSKGFGGRISVIIVLLAAFYLGMLLQVIVHESGHMIFGLMTGYKFVSFRIGSLMLIKKNGKLKFAKFSLMGTGGQCLMSPPGTPDGDFPALLYNLGGCIMNVLFSSLLLIVWAVFKNAPIISASALIISIVGFMFAVLNGLPLSFAEINNDGSNTLLLINHPETKSDLWKQLCLNELASKGFRLKDMPEKLFDTVPASEMNNALNSTIGVFAVSRYIDMMDFDSAARVGRALLTESTGLLGIHRYAVTAEMIYCELVGNCDKAAIDELYNKEMHKFIQSTIKSMPSSARFAYTYELLYNGDEKAAGKALELFEKASKNYPHQCEIEGERELIAAAKEKYYRTV